MEPDLAKISWASLRPMAVEMERSAAVPSRRRAMERLRDAMRDGLDGPILITGEPGAGKRWLVRRLVEARSVVWQAAEVELSAAVDGLDLIRLAGGELGLRIPDRLGPARLALAAGLRDAQADGRGWVLVVDEVQRAGTTVWEELQVLANRCGRPGGFEAVILLGRTELVRELSRFDAGARARLGRVGLHLHLPPMDLDEAREYLAALTGARLPEAELEAIHRDAMGNPRALRHLAEALHPELRATSPGPSTATIQAAASSRPERRGLPDEVPTLAGPSRSPWPGGDSAASADPDVATKSRIETVATRLPSLLPARPPIRLEDGLVEVGWDGDMEAEPTRPESSPAIQPNGPESATVAEPAATVVPQEQRVEDRYAALQAWAEWSRNRERPSPGPRPTDALDELPADASTDLESSEDLDVTTTARLASSPSTSASVRAEPPHDFAPYSQLFSRLRHTL
jgi:type II secretory pathway predicted ATPase ExeA